MEDKGTSRRIIPPIVKGKERKKERTKKTIGKDSISLLIRRLNYAEDLAKICQCFRKAHVKTEFQGKLFIYNMCMCVYMLVRANLSNGGLLLRNTLILKEEETWGGLEKTLKERRTMEATYEYGEPVTFKPLRRV